MEKTNNIDLNKFYQSKYDYYKDMCIWAVIISVLASNTYWISDCQLFGRIAWETLFPRLFMLIPLMPYIVISKKIDNYKVVIPLSYLMIHGIMWCTIWAIYYLPIKQHANEGFIIMHLMFMALGLCSPKKWSIIFHSLLIVDIIVSYPINYYENIDLMMTLGIPALVAVEAVLWVMENTYKEQYIIKEELRKTAINDQLTKAYNRNILREICKENTQVLKYNKASIIMMDIDHFKNINDTYGHDTGDKILKTISRTIMDLLRKDDILIRWGGEEFLVILPHYGTVKAKEVAENIRKSIEEIDTEVCNFTVSIGVCEYTQGENYNKTIKNADIALYYVKEHGRNQIKVFKNDSEY